jgi:hypothetical protein
MTFKLWIAKVPLDLFFMAYYEDINWRSDLDEIGTGILAWTKAIIWTFKVVWCVSNHSRPYPHDRFLWIESSEFRRSNGSVDWTNPFHSALWSVRLALLGPILAGASSNMFPFSLHTSFECCIDEGPFTPSARATQLPSFFLSKLNTVSDPSIIEAVLPDLSGSHVWWKRALRQITPHLYSTDRCC